MKWLLSLFVVVSLTKIVPAENPPFVWPEQNYQILYWPLDEPELAAWAQSHAQVRAFEGGPTTQVVTDDDPDSDGVAQSVADIDNLPGANAFSHSRVEAKLDDVQIGPVTVHIHTASTDIWGISNVLQQWWTAKTFTYGAAVSRQEYVPLDDGILRGQLLLKQTNEDPGQKLSGMHLEARVGKSHVESRLHIEYIPQLWHTTGEVYTVTNGVESKEVVEFWNVAFLRNPHVRYDCQQWVTAGAESIEVYAAVNADPWDQFFNALSTLQTFVIGGQNQEVKHKATASLWSE